MNSERSYYFILVASVVPCLVARSSLLDFSTMDRCLKIRSHLAEDFQNPGQSYTPIQQLQLQCGRKPPTPTTSTPKPHPNPCPHLSVRGCVKNENPNKFKNNDNKGHGLLKTTLCAGLWSIRDLQTTS